MSEAGENHLEYGKMFVWQFQISEFIILDSIVWFWWQRRSWCKGHKAAGSRGSGKVAIGADILFTGMSPRDLLPPPRTHLLKLPKCLKIMPPTGDQVSNIWRGGHFIFKVLTRHIPLGSKHLKRKTSCRIHIRVFSSPGLIFWSSRGITNVTGSILCNEDKKNRAKSQNTFSGGKNLRSKYLAVWYKRTDSSFTTSRPSLQDSSLLSSTAKNERHSLEFLPSFLLRALFWPLPLMPGIF